MSGKNPAHPQFLVVSSLESGHLRGASAPAGVSDRSLGSVDPWHLDPRPAVSDAYQSRGTGADIGAHRGHTSEALRYATVAYTQQQRRRNIYSRERASRSQQSKKREQQPTSSLLATSPYGAAVTRPGSRPNSRPSTQGSLRPGSRPSSRFSSTRSSLHPARVSGVEPPHSARAGRWQHNQSSMAGSRARAQAQREAQAKAQAKAQRDAHKITPRDSAVGGEQRPLSGLQLEQRHLDSMSPTSITARDVPDSAPPARPRGQPTADIGSKARPSSASDSDSESDLDIGGEIEVEEEHGDVALVEASSLSQTAEDEGRERQLNANRFNDIDRGVGAEPEPQLFSPFEMQLQLAS